LNRKAISAARYVKSDAEYTKRNKPAIRARDRARHKGDRAEDKRGQARDWWNVRPEQRKELDRVRSGFDYHRPFVFIDAEGQDYPGNDIMREVRVMAGAT
jgi:hypothetical protein